MPAHHVKAQAHIRRLYAAPDNTSELLATCDKAYIPSVAYDAAAGSVAVRSAAEADAAMRPRVQLPFPAIDLAWCPFKKSDDNAAFITACHSQPVQLWDCADGEVRASYATSNDSGYHVHAHAVCWFSSPAQQHWIAGGYGGFEDATQVRVFDVVAEGSAPVWSYGVGSTHSKGMVSALHDCAWPGTTSLLAVGFHSTAAVHLIDCRRRCPAASLHGLRHGVQSLRTRRDGADPFHVYVGGSQGDGCIACWDVRRPSAPLFTLARPVHTNQVFEFEVLPGGGDGTHRLVTSSATGGALVYSWRSGEAPSADSAVCIGEAMGTTSGLAVVGPNTVVVSTGGRTYDVSSSSAQRAPAAAPAAAAAAERSADDDATPVFPVHKRQRLPMSDDSCDDDEPCGASAAVESESRSTEAANLAVLSWTH